MRKEILVIALTFIVTIAHAQLSVIKMVGSNTGNYNQGLGAYLKGAYSISNADDITLELGLYDFKLNDGGVGDGTIILPLTAGYRYTLDRSGSGFYIEPQVGYNLLGVTSLKVNGYTQNINFKGVTFAGGTGYIFLLGSFPIDLNLRYQTIKAQEASYNTVSLGLTLGIRFKRK